MSTPRGIRNNNPLNIRVGNNWQGERKPNTDGAFEQFTTMQYAYAMTIVENGIAVEKSVIAEGYEMALRL